MKEICDIQTIYSDNNIYFKTNFEYDNEMIEFNMNDLYTLFNSIPIIDNFTNELSFNRETELFELSLYNDNNNISINMTTHEMFIILYLLYFDNEKMNIELRLNSINFVINRLNNKLTSYTINNINRINSITPFNRRVDIYNKDKDLIALGKHSILNNKGNIYNLYIYDLIFKTDEFAKSNKDIVIYQDNKKITLKDCILVSTQKEDRKLSNVLNVIIFQSESLLIEDISIKDTKVLYNNDSCINLVNIIFNSENLITMNKIDLLTANIKEEYFNYNQDLIEFDRKDEV